MNLWEKLGITNEQWLAYPQWMKDFSCRLATGQATDMDKLILEPELLFTKVGRKPDPWQLQCLHSKRNLLLNCSRQIGKSWTASAIALQTILAMPPALVLVISPSERQSGELMNDKKDKFQLLYEPWRELCPTIKDNEGEKTFANGSRLVALPGKSDANIRGYSSISLLIMDEASRIPDSIYDAVTPMLAIGNGRKIAMSTPFGKRGWFYQQWEKGRAWEKVRVTAEECPRLVNARTDDGKPFLEHERESKGDRVYSQEYLCSFSENVGSVFREEDISAAFVDSYEEGFEPLDFFLQPKFVETIYLDESYKVEMPK